MKKYLGTRSIAAVALTVSMLTTSGCFPLRTTLNPLLATNELVQRMFVAQHLDTFGLMLVALQVSTLLLSSRALGVLAVRTALGAKPAGQQAALDPRRVYMTLDDNTLVQLNTETGAVVAKVALGQQPSVIAASPAGDILAISNAKSDSVSIVTTADNKVSKTVALDAGSAPYGVAVSEDGARVYVVNEAKNSISVIDVAAGRVTATIQVPGGPSKITMSPDGSLLWAPTASGTIHVVDTLTNTVSTTVTGIANPVAVAFNPTGTRAYVTSAPPSQPGAVVVVDTSNYTIGQRIAVGTNPYSITLSPGGTRAYVSNFDSNNVSVIDLLTNRVADTVQTGKAPIEVAIVN